MECAVANTKLALADLANQETHSFVTINNINWLWELSVLPVKLLVYIPAELLHGCKKY